MKIGFGLRTKILIPFLALTFISLGVISSLSFRSIYEISSLVRDNSFTMGEEYTPSDATGFIKLFGLQMKGRGK